MGCGTDPKSWGWVIVPVRSSQTRYSSVWHVKSGSFPELFRNSLVASHLPADWDPQSWADSERWPPLLSFRGEFQLANRAAPGTTPCEEVRLAEPPSEYPRTDYSSSVNISRGWE